MEGASVKPTHPNRNDQLAVCSSREIPQNPEGKYPKNPEDSSTPPGRQPTPEKFYKGGSQEETQSHRREFFLLPNPRDRARSVLSCPATGSGAGRGSPGCLGFFFQRVPLAVFDDCLPCLKPESRN